MMKFLTSIRIFLAGFFMGLANLVPGISGGTMILALGLYEDFINAFSDLTRFRFSKKAITIIVSLFGMSFLTILSMSGVIQFLMESFRPQMLALFIGLTLGGTPLLFRESRPFSIVVITNTVIGFLLMGLVAFYLKPGSALHSWPLYLMGGLVGSSAMILPGISGSYLLLVIGLYLPIIEAINHFKLALLHRDITFLLDIVLEILLPFGLGMILGLVLLSNLLKFLFRKWPKPTKGFLLGLLLGSVLGLWPFGSPPLEKVVRHNVSVEGGSRELKIELFGWNKEIVQDLKELQTDTLKVNISSKRDSPPSIADLLQARQSKAVLMVYDLPVSQDIRKMAKDKKEGRVPLIIIPNTDFTYLRMVLALFLIALGFLITFSLSKIKK